MADALEHEARVRELIQLFSREHDPEKLKLLAEELQQLLKMESTPKTVRNRIKFATVLRRSPDSGSTA